MPPLMPALLAIDEPSGMTAGHITLLVAVIGAVSALVGSLVTALVARRGQRDTADAGLRGDMMRWIGVLRQELDDLKLQVADDSARHRAHVLHLESWGAHAPEPPPRVPPPFRWPPAPPAAPTTPGPLI